MSQQQTFKFGIMSTAGIANKVASGIEDCKNAELVAIASRSVEKAQKWCQDYNRTNLKVFGSYDELLDDQSIDCVYIPLPTGMKFEWAVKAVQKGKHILVEKPLAGSVDTKQLQELLQLCAQNNKQFMDCTMFTHSPRQEEIINKIQQGQIGEVQKVISAFTLMSDDSFLSSNIRTNIELEPLGALGDMVWYSSMAALYSFQFEQPERVQAISWKYYKDTKSILEASAVLHFKNGRTAFVDGSFCESSRQNWEIVGQTGTFRIDDFVGANGENIDDMGVFMNRHVGAGHYLQTNLGKREIVQIEKTDQVERMVHDFTQSIINNDQQQKWGKRTLLNQQVMVHLNNSIQQNGAIQNFDNTL